MLNELQGRARQLKECAETLSAKQRLAVIKFLEFGDQKKALLEAGYTSVAQNTRQSKYYAIKFFSQPKIQTYLTLVREYLAGMDIAGVLEIQKFYTDVMRNPKVEMKIRLKAGELLGKCNGLFLDKKQIESEKEVILINDLTPKLISNEDKKECQQP